MKTVTVALSPDLIATAFREGTVLGMAEGVGLRVSPGLPWDAVVVGTALDEGGNLLLTLRTAAPHDVALRVAPEVRPDVPLVVHAPPRRGWHLLEGSPASGSG